MKRIVLLFAVGIVCAPILPACDQSKRRQRKNYNEMSKDEQIAWAKQKQAERKAVAKRERARVRAAAENEKRAWENAYLFYVNGCENGKVVVPVVNVWNRPGGVAPGTRVIGRVSGTGKRHRCRGAIVQLLGRTSLNGREWVKIRTLIGDQVGWFTDTFEGPRYFRGNCKRDFRGHPKALARCLGK